MNNRIAADAAAWALSKVGCPYSQEKRNQDDIFDCVSIALMRVPSKSRFDITGVAAIFLLPRRSERTPAGQAATVYSAFFHVPMGMPPVQSTCI